MFECNICFETAFEPVVTRCGHLSEARIPWKNGSIGVFLEGFCGDFVACTVYIIDVQTLDRQGHEGHGCTDGQ